MMSAGVEPALEDMLGGKHFLGLCLERFWVTDFFVNLKIVDVP